LGKRLTLRVASIMHDIDRCATLSPDASWLEIVSGISKGGLGAAPVVDKRASYWASLPMAICAARSSILNW
jgi:hypothetical protein